MSDLVKEMLGKFIALSQEEKAITAENDAALKEYSDYCAGSEKDLNEKIDEIHKKMDKLNYFMEYAREHADANELEEATAPFDTPDGTLESIRQTIKLDSNNDPNAETLYIKATGKKLFYEQEIDRVRQLIEGSKVQAKRQFDSETAKLNKRKEDHFEKVRSYVQSSDFAEYLKLLVYDKSAFNSPGTVNLSDDSSVSLGQRRVKLSVPMDIEQDVAMNSNGEYNAAARTIGAPYQVSAKKGGTLFLEHDERNGQYLLGGVQRLLLNFIKYFGNNLMRVIFCDPDRFSVDTLGNISALGKGINPFITVPKSMEEIEGKVARLAAKAEATPTPDMVSRILVLQSFPEKYSPELAAKVLEICRNAEKTGVLVVLTHSVSSEAAPVEAEIRELSEVIRSRNGGFWIERERESLFWYSAPSDISDEVRRVYVEKRNQDALKAAQELEPAPVEAPKAEIKPEPAPVEAPKAETKPEPAPVEAPKAETKPEPAPVEAPKAEIKPEPAPVEAPKAETKPVPAPVEAPKVETKPEPAPVEAPKAEIKPEPAPVEAPKAEIKPEPAPVEAPKAEIKPEPAPVEAPKAEIKPEPAPVEAPKAEIKPEPAPVEAPKAETKPEPAPVAAPKAETKPEPAHVEAPKAESEPAPAPNRATSRSDQAVPAHILFANPQPKTGDKEVTMTVLSEISDQLPPPAPDPFEALVDVRPRQEIDPELTYRITDRPSPANPANQTPASGEIEMTYKITDHPDRVASMNAAKPEPQEYVEKTNPIKNVLDAGKRKIESLVDSRKNNDYPIRSLLDDEPAGNAVGNISMDPDAPAAQPTHQTAARAESGEIEPEMTYKITDRKQPSAPAAQTAKPAHQTAARETNEITADMTYKITDFPEKVASMNAPKPEYVDPEDKPGAIKTVIGAGKNVIDAGKRKIESLVEGRKNNDYPIRSLLDDEPAGSAVGDVSMDAEVPAPEAPAAPAAPAAKPTQSTQSSHQTAARETNEITADMTYKITDFPEKVASMNAPKPEYSDPEDKPGAIKTVIGAGKNVIDAGKRKIESLVEGRKNNDYPIRSLLDDEPAGSAVGDVSMDAEVPAAEAPAAPAAPAAQPTQPTQPVQTAQPTQTAKPAHQTAARETNEITADMTYKITDFPEKVASMNAPKPEYVDPEEKPGAIKTVIGAGKNVIDAGKRKIESLVESRKNNDYPIRSLLDDDEKMEMPADQISMDSAPEAPEAPAPETPAAQPTQTAKPAHQTAAREANEITADMTYKITDFPEKVASMNAPKPEYADPEDKPGAIKTVIGAGKNVIDAGKRKIESLVESRKNNDYPIRSLLDDEKTETPADQISMDPENPAAEAAAPETPAAPAAQPAKPAQPSQPAHQTAARETGDITADMTYKITDFPDKVASMNAPKPGQQPAAKTPTVNENQDMTYRITDKLPTAAKQPAAPTATIELEPEPVEDVFGKGVRKLPQIPIGKSVNGRYSTLNIGGNITYICGNRGDDRKTITDRVITQITAATHPDDVELWLFDCGDGEFMKYADDPAAHIKYLVSDTGADTSTDFADVVAAELERRVEAFAENGWSDVEDIPADVFMPRIMVAVNAFPRFAENIVGTTKYFGRNHNDKLSKLFKSCGGYGIHFLLIGDEFSDSGERPHCLEGVTIHCAVAVSGRDRGISKLFGDIKLYDNEVESLRKIPSGCAFVAEADSSNGLTLVRLGGENAVNEHTYSEVSAYSDKLEEYLGKNPFIGDRKAASRFDDRSDYRAEQIKNRDEGECLLFLGEPCRFMGEYPVRLFDDFGENLLTIAPAREKSSAALMVRAALRSLDEQGIAVEILACRSNPVYSELHRNGELDNLEVFEGGKAEARIKELADMLDKGKRPDVFEIVLGGDLLMASMSASDMLPVLKRALVKGPRDGAHFMFVSGSVAQTEPEFLSLFRHKLVFACPYNEAEKILRDPNCDLPENGFRLSNDYDELTILPYSM